MFYIILITYQLGAFDYFPWNMSVMRRRQFNECSFQILTDSDYRMNKKNLSAFSNINHTT